MPQHVDGEYLVTTDGNGREIARVINRSQGNTRDFIPRGEFFDRWPTNKLVAFYNAKRNDAALEAFEKALEASNGVRLSSQRAADGKAYLIGIGLLTQAEADGIFAP